MRCQAAAIRACRAASAHMGAGGGGSAAPSALTSIWRYLATGSCGSLSSKLAAGSALKSMKKSTMRPAAAGSKGLGGSGRRRLDGGQPGSAALAGRPARWGRVRPGCGRACGEGRSRAPHGGHCHSRGSLPRPWAPGRRRRLPLLAASAVRSQESASDSGPALPALWLRAGGRKPIAIGAAAGGSVVAGPFECNRLASLAAVLGGGHSPRGWAAAQALALNSTISNRASAPHACEAKRQAASAPSSPHNILRGTRLARPPAEPSASGCAERATHSSGAGKSAPTAANTSRRPCAACSAAYRWSNSMSYQ